MPRKSITGFRLEDLDSYRSGRALYTDDDIFHIIEVAGDLLPPGAPKSGENKQRRLVSRRELADRLQNIARNWVLQTAIQKMPTYHQQVVALAAVESAAAKLLAALKVDDEGDIGPMPFALRDAGLQMQAAREARDAPIDGDPERTGEVLLRESVTGVVRLRRWAEVAREAAARRKAIQSERAQRVGRPVAAHTGDAALTGLIVGLVEIGKEFFGLRSSGTAGGPTVRFIQACLEPLNVKLSDDAVRERMRVIYQGRRWRSPRN